MYNDIEDLVYRFQIIYDELIDILHLKYIPTKRTGFYLNPGKIEITDINKTLGHILPDNLIVPITIDDVRLKYKLKSNQTLILTDKSLFDTVLDFIQSHS